MRKNKLKLSKPIFWIAALSLVLISITLIATGSSWLLAVSGLLFFTFATGLGYYLSQKNDGDKSARFAKALFWVAILVNSIGALVIWWFSKVVGP